MTKPLDKEFRNVVEINVMWVVLAGTEVFEDLYTLNGVGEDVGAGASIITRTSALICTCRGAWAVL